MAKYYRWLLFIPVLILILGTFILLSNEGIIKNFYIQESKATSASANNQNTLRGGLKRSTPYGEDLKNNRESAYPYFLLGSGLLLFLLVLPKLTELSFSPTSGFTLKVLQDAQETLAVAKAAALALEAKAHQPNRASIAAEPLSLNSEPIRPSEIDKLEESRIKLETYARLLENKTSKK